MESRCPEQFRKTRLTARFGIVDRRPAITPYVQAVRPGFEQ